jgi:hypothetical protein
MHPKQGRKFNFGRTLACLHGQVEFLALEYPNAMVSELKPTGVGPGLELTWYSRYRRNRSTE